MKRSYGLLGAAKLSSLAAALFLTLVAAGSVPAQAGSWTGGYVGVGAGYSAAVTDTSIDVAGFGSLISVDGLGAEGGAVTGLVGYDLQLDRVVVGVWGDYSWSDLQTEIAIGPIGTLAEITIDRRWAGGLRAGWLWNQNILTYALVGYTGAETSDFTSPIARLAFPEPDFRGWVVGGGAEIALPQGFYLQGQYRYASYNDESASLAAAFGPGVSANFDPGVHDARVALTFKFNGIDDLK